MVSSMTKREESQSRSANSPSAAQARERSRPSGAWLGSRQVLVWGQEAAQAREVLVWGQEGAVL